MNRAPVLETYGTAFRDQLLAKLETLPSQGLARWDCPTLVDALKKKGIYLYRVRSWCLGTDSEFTEKAATIIGLYLNSPMKSIQYWQRFYADSSWSCRH